METYAIMLFMTAFVGVWMMVDWWRDERHQPFPDEEPENQKWEDTQ